MDRVIYDFDAAPLRNCAATPSGAARQTGSCPPSGVRPRIGVIYNPRSHRNRGQDLACALRDGIAVAQPRRREDIAEALAEFAREGIDYLVINGGDGTVRDVLTMGQSVFGARWPVIAVLPKGKTNALNVDLGASPDLSLEEAVAAWSTAVRVKRRPLAIAYEGSGEPPMLGFIFGAGTFTLGIEAGQEIHSLGFFNGLAVVATGAWGVVQALFGSDRNRWRRGTEMTLAFLPSAEPVPRSRHGDPRRRSILLASTLERMPAGLQVFGRPRAGLKLAVLDHARRRILVALPAILAGWRPRWLEGAGLHQLDAEGFAIDVAEPVILDGEVFPAGRYRVEQGPELTFVSV